MQNFNIANFTKTLYNINQSAKTIFNTYVITHNGTVLPIRYGKHWYTSYRPVITTGRASDIYEALRLSDPNELLVTNIEGIYRGLRKVTKVQHLYIDDKKIVRVRVEKDKDLDKFINKNPDIAKLIITDSSPTTYDVVIGRIVHLQEYNRRTFLEGYVQELLMETDGLDVTPPTSTTMLTAEEVERIYNKEVLTVYDHKKRPLILLKPYFRGITKRTKMGYVVSESPLDGVFIAHIATSKDNYTVTHRMFNMIDL